VLRTDPVGGHLPSEAFIFGDEIGGRIGSVKTAWRMACNRAGIMDLHFHDLRHEFACRLRESRAELHDGRDFLGHGYISTTSRYLRSTTLRLERALMNLELREQALAKSIKSAPDNRDSGSIATRLPHAPSDDAVADDNVDPETVDLIEDVLVTQTFAS
jgi:Phage integrase family